MTSVLGLQTSTRIQSESYGPLGLRTREVEVVAYRWTIDGHDIAEWVSRHRLMSDPVTPAAELVWLAGNIDDAVDRLRRLLGQAPPDFGDRTALLVCAVCGDLACGAFTAEVVFDESMVRWQALGYNDGRAGSVPFLFQRGLELQFNRDQYTGLLLAATQAVATAP